MESPQAPLDFKKIQKEQERRRFEYMAEDFFKRWTPEDPHEAAQFNAQLYSLVRQIYMDAQQPVLDQLGTIMGHMAVLTPKIFP